MFTSNEKFRKKEKEEEEAEDRTTGEKKIDSYAKCFMSRFFIIT